MNQENIANAPSSILREFWLSDRISNEEYTAELRRRENEFLSVSREEVKALLLGYPKYQFAAALIRLASWLERTEA
jgi:hypothetical protein